LLDAFEAIISQGYDSRLYIYGQISADIESNFLEKVRSNTRVHYEGTYQQDDLSEILSRMHVLVFPSYYPGEGQPGVLLDALFNNMPVVCTDWRFNDELVENNINGFLVPPRNVEKLSQAMLAYIIDRKLIHEHSHKSGKMFSRHDYALIRQKINRLI
jgi:glycosyltransferase involved in cell wall biosynthesis